MVTESFEAWSGDGKRLSGDLFIPKKPKAVIQFNCGTGVKKEVYSSFLKHLANAGFLCCLWDYRGSGDSEPENLKAPSFTFSDYGIKDMPAIKAYLNRRFPHLPFFIVAHSAGGQQVGFMDNLANVRGVINFAVSAGYYGHMPLAYRMKAYFYFYLFSPVSVLLNGFVKGEALGLMGNLPKGVVYEWRDWLEKEDYFFDPKFYGKTVPKGNFKNYTFPIHTYWTVDDTISNERNTKAYWQHIKSSEPITFTKLEPKKMGLAKIDHFGFFKRNMMEKLWGDVVLRLNNLLEKP